ncbi:U-actitoxin-Avd3l [Drosophila willistoni]|uniref:U-actitoxin-Avd3l n=1 Tax=Drosophila willistoni TaxID=7260 RepID=UPI001F074DA6|nr:U-actitoxin-Avd3l [Drosophila willistoni]
MIRVTLNFLLLLCFPLFAIAEDFVFRQPRCMYVADPGPCTDWVKVWGYDYMTNRCIYYHYGGCGGNPNRFYTKEECIEVCRVKKYKRKRVKREVNNQIDNRIDGDGKADDMIYVDTEQEEDEDYYERDIDDWKNLDKYHFDF